MMLLPVNSRSNRDRGEFAGQAFIFPGLFILPAVFFHHHTLSAVQSIAAVRRITRGRMTFLP